MVARVATIVAVERTLRARELAGVLRDATARARFMVIASCGVRPSEVMRAQPDDVDLERRVWRVRDGKGGYRPGGLYLIDDMLAAWRVFVAAAAWGPFREGSWVRTLRAAGWPATLRPYHLRHSVGIELSEAGTDLADIAAFLGHTRVQTTRSHYVPVLSGRMKDASERLTGRIVWDPQP
jgi:integrase